MTTEKKPVHALVLACLGPRFSDSALRLIQKQTENHRDGIFPHTTTGGTGGAHKATSAGPLTGQNKHLDHGERVLFRHEKTPLEPAPMMMAHTQLQLEAADYLSVRILPSVTCLNLKSSSDGEQRYPTAVALS